MGFAPKDNGFIIPELQPLHHNLRVSPSPFTSPELRPNLAINTSNIGSRGGGLQMRLPVSTAQTTWQGLGGGGLGGVSSHG